MISLSAQLHAEERSAGAAEGLWLASVTKVAAGAGPAHEEGKSKLRGGDPGAAAWLWEGLGERLRRAAEAIRFQPT